ncbi:MAG: hypothetical protein JJU12_05920 [Chlamydiales bacterium]|nr:hypothetical protein [Chlamydiales bacterium]
MPLLSGIGLALAIIAVVISRKTPPTPPIPFPPPKPPFESFVAGAGIVEASSEDISIGTPFTEIVDKVFVTSGDFVQKGAPLFKLNTQGLEARLYESKAALAVAEAEYKRELDLPRPEDLPPYEARVKQAQSTLLDKQAQYELAEKLENPKALSRDEFNQRKYGALTAQYALEEVEAELERLQAGAWARDLEIYRRRVKEAERRVDSILVDIERSTVRAPFEGFVFRVNIRQGEIAQAVDLANPLLLFGTVDPLHIRVDIDEEDAWRVIKGAPGVAYVRGNSSIDAPLTYVRLEPYLIPKRALTGETEERIDTRVLQIIYAFERNDLPIYPGMLMDVFLEACPSGVATPEREQ